MVGRRLWNERLNSQASASSRPGRSTSGPQGTVGCPIRKPTPGPGSAVPLESCAQVAPTITVGSRPASVRAQPSMAVVVDLPWVPARAMPVWAAMLNPSASA